MKNHGFLMRNVLLIISFLFCFSVQSQVVNVKPDARLSQCYSKQYIDNLLKTNPEQISYLNYFLDNSYYTVSLKDAQKPIEGIDIATLQKNTDKLKFSEVKYDKSTFNVLLYNFSFSDIPYTYVWKSAGIAIILRPERYVKEDFNMILKTKK